MTMNQMFDEVKKNEKAYEILNFCFDMMHYDKHKHTFEEIVELVYNQYCK